jgi:hypothetical protein
MFSYSNYIIYDFISLSYNPDSGTEFIPNFGKNGAFFILLSYYTPTGFFVKRDKLLSQLIKFKYENIK